MKTYYYLYIITNLINKRFYIGVHKTKNINDCYLGSGKIIKNAVERYGIENFRKDIIRFFDTEDEMYECEASIITEEFLKKWAGKCYNIKVGGIGGYTGTKGFTTILENGKTKVIKSIDFDKNKHIHIRKNKASGYTKTGEKIETIKNDKRFLSGELVGASKNQVTVKDKDGKIFNVAKDDERFISGDLVGVHKDTVQVIDEFGCIIRIKKDDERYLTGVFQDMMSGKALVKDKNGKTFWINKDDDLIKSGEYISINKGKVTVIDEKTGKQFSISKEDPRFLSGELKAINKGRIWVCDKNGKKYMVKSDDPRLISRELRRKDEW